MVGRAGNSDSDNWVQTGIGCARETRWEAAEHEVIPVVSWFTEKVMQGKGGMGRKAGPVGGKGRR